MTGDALFNEVFLDDVFVPDDCWSARSATAGGWPGPRWPTSASPCRGLDVRLAARRADRRAARGWASEARQAELGAGRAAGLPRATRSTLLGMRVTLKQLSGTEPGATGSVRKLLGMRHAQQIAELCWSMQGPDGRRHRRPVGSSATPAGPGVLLTSALTIGGGTTDIQLNIIGERILGLPRDPEPPAG